MEYFTSWNIVVGLMFLGLIALGSIVSRAIPASYQYNLGIVIGILAAFLADTFKL